jgi:hypothetical protein
MTPVNLGILQINDPQVELKIRGKSASELKALLLVALKSDFSPVITKPNQKGKWAKVADTMRGTLTNDDVEYLQECSNEVREGFALRDLEAT